MTLNHTSVGHVKICNESTTERGEGGEREIRMEGAAELTSD